jgi:glycosyltransferase involved in cell wall biosynthesis
MKNNKICMIAYAEYFNDARIKSYINSLISEGFSVDLFCLYDVYSFQNKHFRKNLRIFFINKKYQGDRKIIYLFNYLAFFIKCFILISTKYFKEKYFVFHIHNQPDFLVFIPIIPKYFGSKIILDLHDIMIAGVLSKFASSEKHILFKLTALQTKLSVKFCDVLVFADHSQRDFLSQKGIIHNNSHVFLNLPDENYFTDSVVFRSNNKKLKLVFHGTLAERLGIDIGIKAVEQVNESNDVSFTIIGDGDYKNYLINYCESKKIINKLIYFKPFIPVENLQKEIENYDIGIIGNKRTIISEKCMLPVKLMEYLYIGIPVIAPRLEVIQRYFSENMIEFYEPENIDDLSNKIVKLAQNPKRREELVKESKHFFEKFNRKEQEKKYLEIINNFK